MGEITDYLILYLEENETIKDKVDEIAINLESNIKREAPYDQGRLRRSIRVVSQIYKDYSIVTGYYDEGLAPHGIFVLAGTKPHKIVAKNAGGIFYDGIPVEPGEKPHPYKSVMHPGTKPNDFLGRGLKKTLEAYR